MRIARACLVPALAVSLAACHHAPQPAPLTDGRSVLQAMHDRYASTWYHTLNFVQKTTTFRNGVRDSATWYESLKAPDKLRIDIGAPSAGNGVLYTADSLIVLRAGQVVRRIGRGNPFVPLIEGVYVQPLDTTIRQLGPYGFDLTKLYRGTWENRPAYVVGATGPADTASAQFWVDAERLVLVRMMVAFAPNTPLVDAHVGGYQQLAGPSWLAVHNEFLGNGQVEQIEDYSNWRINADLPDALFDPAQWTTAHHWVAAPLP